MNGDECIEGTWRAVFLRTYGGYSLTELLIYADGLLGAPGLVTLDEFRTKVAAGEITAQLPAGARVSVGLMASWTAAEPTSFISDDELVLEVIDEIDRLAGRPTTSERCLTALDAFLSMPTEDLRNALHASYLEIPRHLRTFVLGDMDAKDFPLRTLMTPLGATIDGRTVTAAAHEQAEAYFAQRKRDIEWADARRQERRAGRRASTLVPLVVYPNGWPAALGLPALRPEFPRPIRYRGRTYRSVHHAYWSAAIADTGRESDLASAPTPYAIEKAAREIGIRSDWPDHQVAVMSALVRRRFRKEKDLAQLLLSTGSTRLLYEALDDDFWGHAHGGENWMGHLLELVRSELGQGTSKPK